VQRFVFEGGESNSHAKDRAASAFFASINFKHKRIFLFSRSFWEVSNN
jgi:hypothetical protein